VIELESWQAAPERGTCEAMKVKFKLQWRLKETGDDRNMKFLSPIPPFGDGNLYFVPLYLQSM
jgi:hypothetical protein